jgi:Ca2+-binding RTX toxin-like protein
VRRARRLVSFGVVLPLAVALGPTSPVAAIGFDFLYPSSQTSCTSSDSLQDCINAAGPGGKVEIDTKTDIDLPELLSITSSFTLTSAPGFHGHLIGGVRVWPASDGATVTVSNLRIDGSLSFLATTGSGGHTVMFDRMRVFAGDLMGGAIDVNTHVPANVTVKRSTASVHGQNYGPSGISFYADIAGGQVTLRALGNVMTGHGTTGASSGFRITRYGAGEVRTVITNNRVWDVAQNGNGSFLSAYVYASGTSALNVSGNTFDRSGGDGVFLSTNLTGSGALAFNLFNTIVSRASGHGVSIAKVTGSTTPVVQGGRNDFFANGPNVTAGHDLGSSLAVAPGFVNDATGNLRLTEQSPLIDQGIVCSPAGIAITDAGGLNRLAGTSLDIGAYERGAAAPTGKAVTGTGAANTINGTPGSDILCGMDGPDTIRGMGGGDYIDGGAGTDVVSGGSGPDRLFGGPDGDTLCASDGTADVVKGGAGTDRYTSDSHDTLISVEVKQSHCPLT